MNKRKSSSLLGRGLLCSALAIAASGALTACSVLYDLSTEQCQTDADCQALGGELSDLVCVNKVCQPQTAAGGCDTNADCLDGLASAGEPTVCMRDASNGRKNCVDLKTTGPECPIVLPDSRELWRENLRNDNVLILGGFSTLNPTTLDSPYLRNYDMVLTEVNDATGGGLPAGTNRRPVVMVVCQSTYDDVAQLDTSINHLAQLGVPGVVAGLEAEDIQRIFESTAFPANMFMMSTNESDSTLVSLNDDGLLWQVGPGGGSVARAYAPLLERAVTYQGITDTVRVVNVLRAGQRLLQEMNSAVISSPENGGISFNDGKSVFQNNEEGNYKSIQLPSDANNAQTDLSAQAEEILEFKPHIVVASTGVEFVNKIVPVLEREWSTAVPGQPPPFYLVSPFLYNTGALTDMLQDYPTVRSRLVGVNPPAAEEPDLYQAYTLRFDDSYQAFIGERGYENYYDAAYYLVYAAAGAGNLLTSGQDIKRGMARLLSGLRYNVGPDKMSEAMGLLLGTSSTISLWGTLGPPLFDANTGSRTDVGTAWCVMPSNQYRADVLRYNTTSKTMDGTFPCFTGF